MPQLKRPVRVKPSISLRDFYNRRNKVLIQRNIGGLGDILMHRMVFEDFKNINPEMEIVFAVLPQYFDAVKDHPYIDQIVDATKVEISEYNISYNTSNCCYRYEMSIAPNADKHRSDIWAAHCGVELKNHNMHIRLSDEEMSFGRNKLTEYTKGNVAILAPLSAMPSKNLLKYHLATAVKELKRQGFFILGLHNHPISDLDELGVPVLTGLNTREWMSIIANSDCTISADSAAFHCAGGMGKPVVGIYTWACGYTYGQWYPTATIVQLHRKTHPEWKCGPCYLWPDCPFTTKPEKPCLTKITAEMIVKGIETMLNKE